MTTLADRRGFAPPINGGCAAHSNSGSPRRLHRTRRKNVRTPPGAVYVGRPTDWGNPFAGRPKIGHARSVILYAAWIKGDLNPHILTRAGFGEDEIAGLRRWRDRLIARLPDLEGKDLQCWCPTTSPWCHADVLLDVANRSEGR
ncbi:hypothetical protein IWY39_000551 [Sphingobium sp. JAI105]|uniref:DUF4326 domain-containing protein n=1 Tax=Sphingobium sp. JAI105 TaxID=2787715 RepID=UPI0018CA18D8|nr:DUF4326 domain-containing protein [Sphingobium sp. JAI105]MBG6116747.1 hypothetical protein [Sphingobium sp. JAI105]